MCAMLAHVCIQALNVAGVQTCAFFFSSRRRHTRSDRDWSSDVCSSDLTRLNSSHDQISYAVFCLRLQFRRVRAEEHTSELQSRSNLGCRLLPERKQQRRSLHTPQLSLA